MHADSDRGAPSPHFEGLGRRWRAASVAVSCSLALGTACGDSGGDTQPAVVSLPALSSCSAGWQPLFGMNEADSPAPDSIALAGGSIIFDVTHLSPDSERPRVRFIDAFEPSPLGAGFSVGDGTRMLGEGAYREVWVEGDRVLYAGNDTRLLSLPLAGGTSEVLLALDGFDEACCARHLLDAGNFYWTDELESAGTGLWRAARAGGEATRFGWVPDRTGPIVLAADEVVVSLGVSVVAVPLAGGEPRPLVTPPGAGPQPLGLDPLGAYWVVTEGATGVSQVFFAPLDGSAKLPFWTDKPPATVPLKLWADGRGGWLAMAFEPFDDGHTHTDVWQLETAGVSRRLACDPSSYSGGWVSDEGAPPVGNDAAYFVVVYPDLSRWDLVRVPF